jgi:hypothetical protein
VRGGLARDCFIDVVAGFWTCGSALNARSSIATVLSRPTPTVSADGIIRLDVSSQPGRGGSPFCW